MKNIIKIATAFLFTLLLLTGCKQAISSVELNNFTITFNSDGGSETSSQTVEIGQLVKEPADPVKTGSVFSGWFKENTFENKWIFNSDSVIENTTLYAKWELINYTLNIDTEGVGEISEQTIGYGLVAVFPTVPVKDGFSFAGWFKEDTYQNSWNFNEDTLTSDTILYAYWVDISFPYTSDNVLYELNKNLGSVYYLEISGSHFSTSGEITIPGEIEEIPVVSIKEDAFAARTNITKVVLPDSINSIGSSAFKQCSALTSIYIPQGVTSIEENTFYYCTSLSDLSLPESLLHIKDYAFSNCSSIESISIPESLISLGNYTFANCININTINFPESVASIGTSSFYNCSSITEIIFSANSNLETIESSAFNNCKGLIEVTLPSSLISIGENGFNSCSALEEITIPENVAEIGASTFRLCTALKTVTIQSELTEINDYTFYDCTDLTEINLPGDLETIGISAFSGCTALENLTIPEKVSNINNSAFGNCTALKNFNMMPIRAPSIGFNIFTNLTGITLHLNAEADKDSYDVNPWKWFPTIEYDL